MASPDLLDDAEGSKRRVRKARERMQRELEGKPNYSLWRRVLAGLFGVRLR